LNGLISTRGWPNDTELRTSCRPLGKTRLRDMRDGVRLGMRTLSSAWEGRTAWCVWARAWLLGCTTPRPLST
jgi:hypothetical protein